MLNYFRIAKYNIFDNVISTIFTILTLIVSFSLSITLSIITFNTLNNSNSEMPLNFGLMIIYAFILLVIFLIVFINIYSLYSVIFLRREKYYAKLKVIGATEKQIFCGIILENIILLIITVLLSFLIINALMNYITDISLNSLDVLNFVNIRYLSNSIYVYLIPSALFVISLFLVIFKMKKFLSSIVIVEALKSKKEFLNKNNSKEELDGKNIINQYIYMNIKKRRKDALLITLAITLLFSILISSLVFFNIIKYSTKNIETLTANNNLLVKIENKKNNNVTNNQRLEFISDIAGISEVDDIVSFRMNQILLGMILSPNDLKSTTNIKQENNKIIISLNVLSIGDKKFKEISNNKDVIIIDNYNGKSILEKRLSEVILCADYGSDYKNSLIDESKCSTYRNILITDDERYNYNWLDDNLTIIVSDQLFDQLHLNYNYFGETNIDYIDDAKYSDVYIKTSDVTKTIAMIDSFNNLGLNILFEDLNEMKENLRNSKLAILVVVGMINILISISIIINILNIILNIVVYRKKEFLTLRILGMKRKHITKIIFLETAYYLIKGIIMGFLVGISFGYLIYMALKLFFKDSIFIFDIPFAVIFISIICVLIFLYASVLIMSNGIKTRKIWNRKQIT